MADSEKKEPMQTFSSVRTVPPANTSMVPLLHELANDAAAGLIQRMTALNRLKHYDQMSSGHGLVTIEWGGQPVVIIFSATVLPLEHIDIYGKTFADDIQPLVNRPTNTKGDERCRHCDRPIRINTGNHWVHKFTGHTACVEPVGNRSLGTVATPQDLTDKGGNA